MLGLKGFSTVSFEDPEHFLASLRPEWQGCVVTDVDMAGMSGLELQERLRKIGCPLPVVVMSGSWDPGVEARALAAGAAGFIPKPFDPNQIIAAVTAALNETNP